MVKTQSHILRLSTVKQYSTYSTELTVTQDIRSLWKEVKR